MIARQLALLFFVTLLLSGCQKRQDMSVYKSAQEEDIKTLNYTCPMHPHYISTDKDGACPICGMDLVPVNSSSQQMQNQVSVSSEMIQTMGIKSVPVTLSKFGGEIRAFGQVKANTKLETVTTSRLEGWIESLSIRAEGDSVQRGTVLYRIYSPELLAAQKDYLASMKIGNERRIASVRKRLKSKGLQDSTIDNLTDTQEVLSRIPIYAENAGIVTTLEVREGDFVKRGAPIMRLQSYKTVWVMASVPESDLPNVTIGLPVALTISSAKNAPKEGVIDYIYPTIDMKTRTATIRVVVENPERTLRPGAYVDLSIARETVAKKRLSIPTQSILRDGQGAHVIIDLGDGQFEPRLIEIGEVSQGRTEIISGLSLGERVVFNGQFLLDSEVNLRKGLMSFNIFKPSFDTNTPLSDLPIDATALSEIDHIVDAALYFHEALMDGYAIDPYFLDPIIQIAERLETKFKGSKLEPVIEQSKQAIMKAKISLKGDALANDLEDLMMALESWLMEGAPMHYKSKGLILYNGNGKLWLQEGGLPANPYRGQTGIAQTWRDPMSSIGHDDE